VYGPLTFQVVLLYFHSSTFIIIVTAILPFHYWQHHHCHRQHQDWLHCAASSRLYRETTKNMEAEACLLKSSTILFFLRRFLSYSFPLFLLAKTQIKCTKRESHNVCTFIVQILHILSLFSLVTERENGGNETNCAEE